MERSRRHHARAAAWMGECPAVRQIAGAGSWRRGRETIGDLDLVVDAADPAAVMDHLAAWQETSAVLLRGDTKTSVRGPRDVQIDLRVVDKTSFCAALQYFTGSKEHNVKLRSRAREQGLRSTNTAYFRSQVRPRPRQRNRRAAAAPPKRRSTRLSACPGYRRSSVKEATRSGWRSGRAAHAGGARRHPRRSAHAHDGHRRRRHTCRNGAGRDRTRPRSTSPSPIMANV